MSILTAASGASVWRGYNYFVEKKVLSSVQTGAFQFEGNVSGSGENVYHVVIDVQHPKKSVCDCPYAEGTRIVCKHKVALYFEAFPAEADEFIKAAQRYEEEQRQRELDDYHRIVQYVNSLSLEQLRVALIKQLSKRGDEDDFYDEDYEDEDFDDEDCEDEDCKDEDYEDEDYDDEEQNEACDEDDLL